MFPHHALIPGAFVIPPLTNQIEKESNDTGKKKKEAEVPKAVEEVSDGKPTWASKREASKVLRVHRRELKLSCDKCKFVWHGQTLTVWCPKEGTHRLMEFNYSPDYIFYGRLALNYYDTMPLLKCPKTGNWIGKENAKFWRHGVGNEKRGLGMHEYWYLTTTERQGMSRDVSKVGQFRRKWKTHFPYPT